MIFPVAPSLLPPSVPSLSLSVFLSSLSPFHPERFRNKLQVRQNNGCESVLSVRLMNAKVQTRRSNLEKVGRRTDYNKSREGDV